MLVDNGSTDESLALVRKEHPKVRVVEMEKNGYFAGAVNEGIRRSDGEIVVLLNNDTEADPEWLERLVGALDRNPWATSAASKLRLFDPAQRHPFGGRLLWSQRATRKSWCLGG